MSAAPVQRHPVNLAAPARRDDHVALRKAADQLQAVFLNQLFQAMRASVPKGDYGVTGDGGGEEMFQSMMDERISQLVAPRLSHGVGDALYHQLARRLDAAKEKP